MGAHAQATSYMDNHVPVQEFLLRRADKQRKQAEALCLPLQVRQDPVKTRGR